MSVYDRNEKMLENALQKEPYVCKTVGDIDWVFEKLSSERLKQAVESPVYGIAGNLTREEHLRELLGDWRVEKPFHEC